MSDQSGKLDHTAPAGTQQEFLQEYRKREYPRPSVTVDLVIFTVQDTDLKVLLIRRKGHPYKGCWALPGGFLHVGDAFEDQGEDLDAAAFRELEEETGLSKETLSNNRVHLEQLSTFGKAYRDIRTRVVSVAYFALVPQFLMPLVQAGSDASEARWFSYSEEIQRTFARPEEPQDAERLAFDHHAMLDMAVERIRGKIDYTPLAFSLVPPTFSVPELREIYEGVKGETYDASNFRRRFKRMVADGVIVEAPGKRVSGSSGGRPALVYRFAT